MDYIKRIFLEVLDKDYDHETPDKPRTVAFHKACTKALKEMVRPYNYVVHTSSPNWRDFTAFVEDPESGKYIFVSCEYNDSQDSKWGNRVMYRAAKSLKDYSGGRNNFTNFNSLGEEIHKLFQVTARGVWESTSAGGKQGLDSLSVATEDNNDFFGKLEVEKYGDVVVGALGGKKISKEKQLANMRGGISYEASRLGMAWTDLIRTLEGLCYLRRAEEIDDSTYYVYPPNSHILGSQEGLFDKVFSTEKTKLQIQALKELIEEKNEGEDDNLLEGINEAAATEKDEEEANEAAATEYSDGLRLYQVSKGYAIVAQSYYDNYANRAFVDRVVSTIEEARIVQASLERNDRMSFTIFNCNTRPIAAEESTYGEFFETKENNKMDNEMNFDDEDFDIEPEEDMEEGDTEFENGPEEDVERIKREKEEDMDKYSISLGLVQEIEGVISHLSQVQFMLPEYSDILKEIYNQELHILGKLQAIQSALIGEGRENVEQGFNETQERIEGIDSDDELGDFEPYEEPDMLDKGNPFDVFDDDANEFGFIEKELNKNGGRVYNSPHIISRDDNKVIDNLLLDEREGRHAPLEAAACESPSEDTIIIKDNGEIVAIIDSAYELYDLYNDWLRDLTEKESVKDMGDEEGEALVYPDNEELESYDVNFSEDFITVSNIRDCYKEVYAALAGRSFNSLKEFEDVAIEYC